MAVVIDPTIVPELNAGNEGIANQLIALARANTPLYMTRKLFNELSSVEANEHLLREIGVRVPADDNYAKNSVMQRKLSQMVRGDLTSAALVLHLSETLRTDARLMTTDREAASQFQKYYGRVLLVTAGSRVNRGVDYNQARRLLGLMPLVLTANGKVVPAPNVRNGRTLTVRPDGSVAPRPKIVPLPGGTPPPATIDGKPWSPRPEPSSARGGNPVSPKSGQATQVDPKTTPTRPMPTGSRPESGKGIKFVFQGINYIIQGINDSVQKGRFEARWAQLAPGVQAKLAENPTLGALVRVFYYKRAKAGAENESPMDHTHAFKDIQIAYGVTRDDALASLNSGTQIATAGAGNAMIDDSLFIPPKVALDYTQIPTPYPAEGLATFIPGKAALLSVRWSDEFRRTGENKLQLPAENEVRFLYLRPPDTIDHRENQGRIATAEIEWTYHPAGETLKSYGPHFPGVPAIGPDTPRWFKEYWGVSPSLLKLVMVYPANAMTAKMFNIPNRLLDPNGELAAYPHFRKQLRFVDPKRMRVLRAFNFEQSAG